MLLLHLVTLAAVCSIGTALSGNDLWDRYRPDWTRP